jgi:hypothetical protein
MKNELRNLMSQLGGRISSVQARDANATRQEVSIEGGFVYTSRLAFLQGGRRIDIKTNQELGRISIFGQFDIPFFTIHSRDRSGFASSSIGEAQIGPFSYEIFAKDGVVTNAQSRLLHSAELADLISSHPFRKGEALHFYRNCLVLYVRVEDLSTVLVSSMVALAAIIPKEDKDTDDLELPADFTDLVSILRDWGVPDDEERSDRICDASEQELRYLLAVIEPRMGSIHSYLSDTTENSASNAAANLGRIVEATIEAKAALLSRNVP